MREAKLKKPQLPRSELFRRGDKFLKEIQKSLLPDHANEYLAINLETGEYVLGKTAGEVFQSFLRRWPDALMHHCRVDGGPAIKFHGK